MGDPAHGPKQRQMLVNGLGAEVFLGELVIFNETLNRREPGGPEEGPEVRFDGAVVVTGPTFLGSQLLQIIIAKVAEGFIERPTFADAPTDFSSFGFQLFLSELGFLECRVHSTVPLLPVLVGIANAVSPVLESRG
jgi:hypothetical protein